MAQFDQIKGLNQVLYFLRVGKNIKLLESSYNSCPRSQIKGQKKGREMDDLELVITQFDQIKGLNQDFNIKSQQFWYCI